MVIGLEMTHNKKNLSLFLNFLNTRYFTSNSYVTTNGVYMA